MFAWPAFLLEIDMECREDFGSIPFEQVKEGECFSVNFAYYIKTPPAKTGCFEGLCNAVRLVNGEFYFFNDQYKVVPHPKAEIVIK